MGGWIADELGWRYPFLSEYPGRLGDRCGHRRAGLWPGLPSPHHPRRITRFDSIGFILLAVVLGGLQTILNQGNDFEWFQSPFLSSVLPTVIVALPCFLIWELGEHRRRRGPVALV
jgi:MFS transporter, DHA2 family, multidrug resistance protein